MAPDTDDRAVLEALHVTHRSGIRRYLARLVGDADADDLVQDVFERAQRALAAARARPSHVGPWLYRIATHVAVDRFRSRAVREREDVALGIRDAAEPDHAGPDRDVDRSRMRACILDLVDRLPMSQRSVLLLAEMRGLSDRETAEALGVSLGAAKIRLHRARWALRAVMSCACRTFRDERNEFACERVTSGVVR
jgi:RNA polymerase sigma-70 factor (ECF subfamily)